ncbi:indolepyruvate oxidoreductase subunit beta [Lutibacter sp. A80]|uniref:indolepyruvate oxidoreductase subunit beta n=1 Tax=Lutibacter sp. A80 TaxID=2918453 RepID=UPI001F06BFC8|nr:indolepyruvate oxidoreductase subunit beta [Lutibacter sp. A80]UMB60566.1 indolepyruvate oxidoreductase subunit beta [Lutibacter sp. A80]
MKTNIILAGVGGQGILTIAAVLDTAAIESNLNIKQSEVHGMSQRGGAVQSHVRISDEEIFSDLIPEGKADMIISVEPMELLRYLPFLKKDGFLITDSNPFENIKNYPELEDLYKEIKTHKNSILINAKNIAKEIGNSRATNIVLLGAASSLLPLSDDNLQMAIKMLFEKKGERIINKNLEAYQKGKEIASEKVSL